MMDRGSLCRSEIMKILQAVKGAEQYHHPDERREEIRRKCEDAGHRIVITYDFFHIGDHVVSVEIDGRTYNFGIKNQIDGGDLIGPL